METSNSLYLATIATDSLQPALVKKVSDNLMYIGYCAPDCKSTADKKWCIKKIETDESGLQKITKSNGSLDMNVAWDDYASLTYKPTENWEE